jgi:hypothetical protein
LAVSGVSFLKYFIQIPSIDLIFAILFAFHTSTIFYRDYILVSGQMANVVFNGNVFFLGVARIASQNQGIVVGSFSYNTETDLAGVKQLLEQPNNLTTGKHFSFSAGKLAWHLIQGF